jgi:hypothetical protein
MKFNKKPLTKNLVYSNVDLNDDNYFEDAPKESRKLGKFVKKMKDRYDQAINRSGSFKNRGGLAY